MSNENPDISLVIPAYNESKVIASTLNKSISYLSVQRYDYEIVVVDDGSTDNTADLVLEFCKQYPKVKLIRNIKNKGKGFSVKRGVLFSKGNYIFFSDADLSTPIAEAENLLFYFSQGYDIVVGSRALKESRITLKQPWPRQGMGKFFNLLVRLLGLSGIKDTQCGFKCFSREVAQRVFRLQRFTGFSFDVEILYIGRALGYKIKDVPITWVNRVESRVGVFRDSFTMLIDLLKIKKNALIGLYNEA